MDQDDSAIFLDNVFHSEKFSIRSAQKAVWQYRSIADALPLTESWNRYFYNHFFE